MVIYRIANKFFTNHFDAKAFAKWQKDNWVLTTASRDVFEVIVEEHPIPKPKCLHYYFGMDLYRKRPWLRYSTEVLGSWSKTNQKINYDSNSETYYFSCEAVSLSQAQKKADKIYKQWKQQQQQQQQQSQ